MFVIELVEGDPAMAALVRDGRGEPVGVVIGDEPGAMPARLGALPRIVRSAPLGGGLAWLSPARAAWFARADALERAPGGAPLVIYPRARDVISDVPSTLTFLRSRPAWRLMLDPAELLTPEMVERAEEHLTRFADTLAQHEAMLGVVLPSDDDPLAKLVRRLIVPVIGPSVWRVRKPPGQTALHSGQPEEDSDV